MKSFGTWGTAASYQLGGIIGLSVAIAGIALGGWVPLVGVGVAIVITAVAGLAINAYDKATGSLERTTRVMGSTAGKLMTGAAVVGLVTTIAIVKPDNNINTLADPNTQTTAEAVEIEAEPQEDEVEVEAIEYPIELVYKGIDKNIICQCAGKCPSQERTIWLTLHEDGSISGMWGGCRISGKPGKLNVDDCTKSPQSATISEYYMSDDYEVLSINNWQDSDSGPCSWEGTYYLQE